MYRTLRLLPLALLGSFLSNAHLNGQVILNPNHINGTVQFTNTNPAVLSLLGSPGNLGMTAGAIYASSLPPAQPFQDSADFTSISATSATYQVTVDSANPGIAYAVSAIVNLQPDLDTYQFAAANSAPVVSNGPPATVDLRESLTMLDVRFVNAANLPVPVTGGRIIASITGLGQQATAPRITTGATNRFFAVRGGTSQSLDIQLIFGTNADYDGFTLDIFTNITAINDLVIVVYCVVPDTHVLGQITGNISLGGEFLEHTVVEAAYGPFLNERVYNLPGSNFTMPSSGPFLLTNLLPSSITTPPSGYYLIAEMELRTNFQYTYFTAPYLGGVNPAVMVPASGSVDLSNIFNIAPGYFNGQLTLQGPAEAGQSNSLLRSVTRFIDAEPSPDGIPTGADIYHNYGSYLDFTGVGRLAAGATRFTAYGGVSEPSFPGTFNPLSSAFEGSYETVAGGLAGENSVWRFNGLTLLMLNQTSTDENSYFLETLGLQDNRTNDVEVAPGQHYTNDVGYCFSEVSVRFRSTSGKFYSPRLGVTGSGYGTFSGTDFQGHTADYGVYRVTAYGTPLGIGAATNTGLVRVLLPQGTYTLNPRVFLVNTNGGADDTGLPPITLTVGCQQRILIDQCLHLNLNLPACVNSNAYIVAGSVTSCTNVVSLTYQLDGGPTNNFCLNCGVSPAFAFPLDFTTSCSGHTLVVTAYDAGGEVSSATSQLRFNNVPPALTCSSNIVVNSTTTNRVPVSFSVTATGNCDGPVSVICTPPSGSLFPAGTNTVVCYALDGCGNSNGCSFLVTVVGPQTPWLPVADSTGDWRSVASSADGSRLVAVGNTFISTSSNSGATFGPLHGPSEGWAAVASSADGIKLVAAPAAAADGNGSPAAIFASTDAGVTWAGLLSVPNHWTSVASSADGVRLAAAAASPLISSPNYIYTSLDSGTTWSISGAPVAVWTSVASSSNGNKLAAVSDGLIYTSTDAGTNWTPLAAPNTNWSSIASSADGTHLVAAVGGPYSTAGGIYTSTDSGIVWTQTSAPLQTWTSVASSADGSKLVAVAGGVYTTGPIYTSGDSGATWISNNAPITNWTSVATSVDGTSSVAAVAGGPIYIWHTATLGAPRLSIQLTLTNTVLVSWPSPSPGFILQQSPTTTPASWVNVLQTLVDDGTTRSIVINPPSGTWFYRLKNP